MASTPSPEFRYKKGDRVEIISSGGPVEKDRLTHMLKLHQVVTITNQVMNHQVYGLLYGINGEYKNGGETFQWVSEDDLIPELVPVTEEELRDIMRSLSAHSPEEGS